MSLLLRKPSVPENKVDKLAREERIGIRVGTPKQQIVHLFQTKDYGPPAYGLIHSPAGL